MWDTCENLWDTADIMEVELHALHHTPQNGIIPFSNDNVKRCR